MKNKKTITLWFDRDNPSVSIIKGRVTKREFAKAFRNEGWEGEDPHIEYEFRRKTKRGYRKSSIEDLKAELYTVSYW